MTSAKFQSRKRLPAIGIRLAKINNRDDAEVNCTDWPLSSASLVLATGVIFSDLLFQVGSSSSGWASPRRIFIPVADSSCDLMDDTSSPRMEEPMAKVLAP